MPHVSLNDIHLENSLLRHKLAKLGIDRVLLAAELEFTSFPDVSCTGPAQIIKQGILDGFEEDIQSPRSRQERAALAVRKNEIAKFNAREVMMYDILNDPRLSDRLEPLFGTSRAGDGYYDAVGVLELKIKPCDESLFAKRMADLTEVLKEKAAAYGFRADLIDGACVHLSYSFHDKQGNIFAADTHAPDKLQKITTGVSYVLQDMARMIDGYSQLTGSSVGVFRVHPGREEKIRMAPNRMELRLHKSLSEIDIDVFSMAVMAGAAYGLNPKDRAFYKRHVPKTKLVHVPEIANSDPAIKKLQHILEGCIVGDDGHLIPPEQYLWEGLVVGGGAAADELGFTNLTAADLDDAPTAETLEKLRGCITVDGLMDIFKNIRVVATAAGGYELKWPQDRLLIRVKDPNDYFSVDGPRAPFDASRLEKSLRITGLRTAAVTDREMASPGCGWGQLDLNVALQETLSPAMFDNLTDKQAVPSGKSKWGLGAVMPPYLNALATRGKPVGSGSHTATLGQN